MPKAKDLRPVPITWDNRLESDDILTPIINEVLGVRFDRELYNPVVDGISLFVGTKYKGDAPTWRKSEHHWLGTIIKLYFKDSDYRIVHRTLIVKPGEALDADKLRAKWTEMLSLKRLDNKRRQAEEAAKAQSDSLQEMALNEAFALGGVPCQWSKKVSFGRVSGMVQKDGTFRVELSHLTAVQLKAIADLLNDQS